MSSPQRPPRTGVIYEALREQPHRFKFFQALRLLERDFHARGEKQVVGRLIRFKNSLSVEFPASEIESIIWHDEDSKNPVNQESLSIRQKLKRPISDEVAIEMTPAFMGLTGLNGALPRVYTDQLISREVLYKDYAARAFLDIFLNRIVTLFYGAWKKYRLSRLETHDQIKKLNHYFLSFVGCHYPDLVDLLAAKKLGISQETAIYYAGILRHRPVSVSNLQNIISEFFSAQVHIEQFVGRWYTLPESSHTKLGAQNIKLGENVICGSNVWQRNTGMRINIGPLTKEQFTAFYPNNDAIIKLKGLLSLMIGEFFDVDIRLILRKEDISTGQLRNREPSTRLGYDFFAITKPATQDSCDLSFHLSLI